MFSVVFVRVFLLPGLATFVLKSSCGPEKASLFLDLFALFSPFFENRADIVRYEGAPILSEKTTKFAPLSLGRFY